MATTSPSAKAKRSTSSADPMTMDRTLSSFVLGALLLAFMGTASAQVGVQPIDLRTYDDLKQQGLIPQNFRGLPPAVVPSGMSRGGSNNSFPLTLRGGPSACDCWVQPDATYTLAMPPNDDQSTALIPLPFTFNLYGDLYNGVYINNNGNVSFGSSWGTFSSSPLPTNQFAMVAAFWADVDTRGTGQVWYKVTPTAMYINWVGVGYYSMQTNLVNTFQIIITDGNDPVIGIGKNVSICYQDMQWTTGSASSGVNGFGGTPATVGANRGNGIDFLQFTRTDQAGIAYDGPFGLNDGVDWLDNKNFVFTTSVFTSNIPPIGSGTLLCDTLVACVGITSQLDMQFLSPEPGQTTTAISYAPTLSNYSEILNVVGNTAQITSEFTPIPSEVGFHQVTFEATDDGAPPLTATYNLVVWVQMAAAMLPGDTLVCDAAPSFDLYQLLGGTPIPGGDWTDPIGDPHPGTFVPGTDLTGDYLYAVGTGGMCPSTGIVTVSTAAHADAGADVAKQYCTTDGTDDLFLTLTGTPQTGGAWSYPDGTAFGGTLNPASDPSGDYAYLITGTSPCPNDTSFVAVTIQQAMDPGQNATITLCPDATPLDMLITLNGTPDNTGVWTTAGGAVFSGTYNASMDLPGVYTYTTSPLAPCPTLFSTLTISLDPLPQAGGDNGLAICADGAQTPLFPLLGGNPDANQIWYDPLFAVHSGVLDPSLELSGNYRYVAYGIGECDHLTDTSIIAVDVNPLPIVLFNVEPDSGCNPLDVRFYNLTDPFYLGGTCIWDLGDGLSGVNACDSLDHTYVNAGWYNVNLTVTTPEGCVDHLTKPGAVLVEEAPKATFTWSPNPGTEYNSNLYFAASDPHARTFQWVFAELDTADQRFEYHYFPNEFGGDYDVCLQVWDRYGCTDSLCQVVPIIVPSLFVPNAFTPDGDNKNDIFFPVASDMVDEDHELMVFDRWGELVFQTADATKGWDGRKMNGGEILPQGVYVWRLIERKQFTSDKQDYFGTVTLLK